MSDVRVGRVSIFPKSLSGYIVGEFRENERGLWHLVPIDVWEEQQSEIERLRESAIYHSESLGVVTNASGWASIAEEKQAEIERLQAENKQLREAECGVCGRSLPPDGDCHGCRADRAEERLCAVVNGVFLAARHGNVQLAVAENMAVLAGYERCGWCNGEGWIQDNERNEEQPCDCIHGWRPRGDS